MNMKTHYFDQTQHCDTDERHKMTEAKANDLQIGGTHYKDMGVQPWDVMEATLTPEEFIGYLKGNCIKYGMRAGKKDSDDAGKFRHYKMKLKEALEALGTP